MRWFWRSLCRFALAVAVCLAVPGCAKHKAHKGPLQEIKWELHRLKR
jgi:hypothetical protein